MKYFQKLLRELQTIVKTCEPGSTLPCPTLLNSMEIFNKRFCYFQMGVDKKTPAIIFVHGFGGFFMDWPRIMLPFAHEYQTFAIDLPGWGFSEATEEDIGLEYHIDVLKHFIREKKLDEVILVGFSYGAAVTYSLAAIKEEIHIKHLLLINPMPPYPIKYMTSLLYKTIFNINRSKLIANIGHKFMDKNQFRLVLKENLYFKKLMDTFYLDLGYAVIKQPKVAKTLHLFAKKSKTIDWKIWENEIKKIKVPTTILKGHDDKIFNIKSAVYIQKLIPHSNLTLIQHCGHAMVFDQHRKITHEISRILKD